jgi:hypothetical protein
VLALPLAAGIVKVATIVPSGVRALPLAAGINEGVHYFRYFGPSGVRTLPLAAGIYEGGHYFSYFFLFLEILGDISPPKNLETPLDPWGAFLGFSNFFVENFKICPRVPKLWI